MSSAIGFNLYQSQFLSSGNRLMTFDGMIVDKILMIDRQCVHNH